MKHECLRPFSNARRSFIMRRPNLFFVAVSCIAYASFSVEAFSPLVRPLCGSRGRSSTPLQRSTITSLAAGAAAQAHASPQQRSDNNSQRQKYTRGNAPNKKTALKWVVQSIERLAEDDTLAPVEKPSLQLLDALYKLQRANTQGQVAEAGRLLESLDIAQTESAEVQERVIKALSMSGLLSLALDLLDGFIERGALPSSIAYVACCNALRKAGRVKRLEQVLYKLGSIVTTDEKCINVVAMNTFLAALCGYIQDRARLEHARDWLRPGVSRERLGGTEPDASSYATVLNAASSMGNRRMVEELWEEMTNVRKLKPTIYAYNPLLRSARNGPDGNERALDVLDRLLREVQPDRYTIDLVLVPLIRANRIGDVEKLLGDFVESRSVDARTASNAFAAFMNSLIKAGELPTARAVFDTYLLPSLSSDSDSATSIRPTTRHFNLLIDGYKRAAESTQDDLDENDLEEESLVGSHTLDSEANRTGEARENGRKLYTTMVKAGIRPDAYTLTSIPGFSSTSDEMTNTFRVALTDYGVEVTPAVVRSLITGYGNLGDPSSACVAFDAFAAGTMNARTWNALLSVLTKSAVLNSSAVIHIDPSTSAYELVASPDTNVLDGGVCKLVNGLSCYDAIRRILLTMERNGDSDVGIARAPSPNSQTFCIVASALQTGPSNRDLAMELFRNATRSSFSADGRFINAIFRCFGDDIDGALSAWKNEIRRACLAHENRRRAIPPSSRRAKGKNLIASYHGLLYVCGRALRPDIAVRLVYAMNKEELEVNEMALNCYRSGKRTRQELANQNNGPQEKSGIGLALSKHFESVLLVECTKFEKNDRRRLGEKRVRIII